MARLASLLLLLLALASTHTASAQRISRYWWHDFKQMSKNETTKPMDSGNDVKDHWVVSDSTDLAPARGGPTDDELMTQASKLNSKMVRIANNDGSSSVAAVPATAYQSPSSAPAPVAIAPGQHPLFDDSPSDYFGVAASSANSFYSKPRDFAASPSRAPISSSFGGDPFAAFQDFRKAPPQADQHSSNRIWNYFDSAMNKGKSARQQQQQQHQPPVSSFFDRHNKAPLSTSSNLHRPPPPQSSFTQKQQQQQKLDNKNRVLNFNFNRKKNPEEKEKWRQLIQSIFDNAPRKDLTGGSGSGGNSYAKEAKPFGDGYDYHRKTKVMMKMGGGSEEDGEDVLKNEKEEKVDIKTDTWNLNGEEPDDSSEENRPDLINNEEDQSEKEETEGIGKDRIEREDEEERGDNQYLNRPEVNNTEVEEKRGLLGSPSRFGSRGRITNRTLGPKFTSRFGLSEKVQTTTEVPFVEAEFTTTSVFTSTDPVDLENEEEGANNSTLAITTEEPNLSSLLIKKRKPSRMGKWMDSETFEMNDDDENGLPEEEEDEEEPEMDSMMRHTPSVMPKIVTKRILTAKPVFAPVSGRSARQFEQGDNDDDLSRLARTLQGMPGEDFPIFATIPRTTFSCADHQWPGYYADVETQCQVFHLCQRGGRRDSFLCPNGTMFNQQLFVCDWWHNVQCDSVTEHYALNEQIYDYNWESKRNTAAAPAVEAPMMKATMMQRHPLGSRTRNIRRMAVMDDIRSEEDLNDLVDLSGDKPNELDVNNGENQTITTTVATPTTTLAPPIITTTAPAFTTEQFTLTEAVFGNRKPFSPTRPSTSVDGFGGLLEVVTDSKAKRFLGAKGEVSHFTTRPSFYSRHKFASQSSRFPTKPTPKPSKFHMSQSHHSAAASIPAISITNPAHSHQHTITHTRGKYYRT